jgi:hypothetical protein
VFDLLILLNFLSVIGGLALLCFLVLQVVSVILLVLLNLSKSLVFVVLGLLHSSFVLGLEAAWLQAFKLLYGLDIWD